MLQYNCANALRDLKEVDEDGTLLTILRVGIPESRYALQMGFAWQLQERWDRAIEQFQIAISQKSDHAPSHINLGSALAVKERLMKLAMRYVVELLSMTVATTPNLIWD